MQITILKNRLTTEGFTALYTAVGMARLTGDGAMTFLLKDVAVTPEAQGAGVGRLLVSAAEEFVRSSLKSGWAASLELLGATGKEGFYEKLGFRSDCGTGMLKMIRR